LWPDPDTVEWLFPPSPSQVSRSIDFIRETPDMDHEQKAAFFEYASRSFGSTALALSGGATFGSYTFYLACYSTCVLTFCEGYCEIQGFVLLMR
jgi:hypothetical protein